MAFDWQFYAVRAGELLGGLALVALIFEIVFRSVDGPFAAGIQPLDTDRRKAYPWIGGAVAVAILSALLPLWAAAPLSALAAGIAWFRYYRGRRFDYGRAAVRAKPWLNWKYTMGEQAPEAWLGPEGLLCGDVFLPWALSFCRLSKATSTLAHPPSLHFTFREMGSQRVVDVAFPWNKAGDMSVLDRHLRQRCPEAHIQLLPDSGR